MLVRLIAFFAVAFAAMFGASQAIACEMMKSLQSTQAPMTPAPTATPTQQSAAPLKQTANTGKVLTKPAQ